MSLINNETQHVKFISYTGEYPNLCRGVLTLEINGNVCRFGHDCSLCGSWGTDGNYERFWISGGRYCLGSNYRSDYAVSGEWVIDVSKLPEELRQYASEIDTVFNDNVPEGCCGGCL